MRNKTRRYAGVLVLGIFSNAYADQTTHRDCSSNIENIQQGGTVNISCYFNKNSPQDVYLIATHPTLVEAEKVHFLNMFEDNGRFYLSLALKNISEIPARDVTVDLMDPSSAGTYSALKPFKLSQSKVAAQLGTRKWTIPRHSSMDFPFVSLEQLVAKVHSSVDIEHFCPFDGSLVAQEAPNEPSTPNSPDAGTYSHIVRVPIVIKVHYKTIFEETITKYLTAFVLYADRRSTRDVWYPSVGKPLPLKCAKY